METECCEKEKGRGDTSRLTLGFLRGGGETSEGALNSGLTRRTGKEERMQIKGWGRGRNIKKRLRDIEKNEKRGTQAPSWPAF